MRYAIYLTHRVLPTVLPNSIKSEAPATTLLFQKVICTSDFIANLPTTSLLNQKNLSIVSEEELPIKTLSFLKSWGTKGMSDLEKTQEEKIWRYFFIRPPHPLHGITSIQVHRCKYPHEVFSIIVLDDSTQTKTIQKIFSDFYDSSNFKFPENLNIHNAESEKIKKLLQKAHLPFKGTVNFNVSASTIEKTKSLKDCINTSLPFDVFCKKYGYFLNLMSMYPSEVEAFALAPTIDKLTYLTHLNGTPLSFSLETHKKSS